jgi:hypothetical protein
VTFTGKGETVEKDLGSVKAEWIKVLVVRAGADNTTLTHENTGFQEIEVYGGYHKGCKRGKLGFAITRV